MTDEQPVDGDISEPEDESGEYTEPYSLELVCEEPKRQIQAGSTTQYLCKVKNIGKNDDVFRVRADIRRPSDSADAPEWVVKLTSGVEGVLPMEGESNQYARRMKAGSTVQRMFNIEVTAPHKVNYGEKLDVIIDCTSEGDPVKTESIVLTTAVRQSLLAVKTSIGHERTVADALYNRADDADSGVYAILAPAKLRGYLLIEAINPDALQRIVRGIKRARGVVEGETTFDEINHFLTPKPLVSGIVEGDIVELVAGPFKGEKARVQQIDEAKEEITVELFEAVVPIPITVRGDHVRVLESKDN